MPPVTIRRLDALADEALREGQPDQDAIALVLKALCGALAEGRAVELMEHVHRWTAARQVAQEGERARHDGKVIVDN